MRCCVWLMAEKQIIAVLTSIVCQAAQPLATMRANKIHSSRNDLQCVFTIDPSVQTKPLSRKTTLKTFADGSNKHWIKQNIEILKGKCVHSWQGNSDENLELVHSHAG